MSHFIETFKAGKLGYNLGLTTGLPVLDKAINGIQKKTTIGLAASPKCGKTTLCDFSFIIQPYLALEKISKLENIEWIYYSYEIDRVSKEFKFAAFFMAYDFGVYNFTFNNKLYLMNADYLQGKQLYIDEKGLNQTIPIQEEHEEMIKTIYDKRIIPLFGEYDIYGRKLKTGKIIFIEERDNPTGMWKLLKHHAKQNGEFIYETYNTIEDDGKGGHKTITKQREIAYKENNPHKFTVVVTDHLRRMKRERNFSLKENIDKWLEYSTDVRNLCSYTFIHIVHSNRQLANVDRLKIMGEKIFPTGDDTKDSGNFAEECTILMTLFNANDEKYNLTRHFGVELKDYPFYRSLHITESRYTECPVHMQFNMIGGINMFTPLQY